MIFISLLFDEILILLCRCLAQMSWLLLLSLLMHQSSVSYCIIEYSYILFLTFTVVLYNYVTMLRSMEINFSLMHGDSANRVQPQQ